MSLIGSEIKPDDLFKKNAEASHTLRHSIASKGAVVMLGGGADAIAKQHKRGKLTARERIDQLVDPGQNFWKSDYLARTACMKNMVALLLAE